MSQVLEAQVGQTIREQFAGTDVTKLPLTGPDGLRTDLYGLFTDSGEHVPRSAVTKRYLPHTVDDIAALAEAAAVGFDADSNASVQCRWTGAQHKVVLGPTMRHQATIANPMDKIWPRVVITGGFNGTAFVAEAGMFRFACSNLQMIRQVGGCRVSFKHTDSLRSRIDELVVNFRNLASKWDEVVDFSVALNQQTVATDEFIDRLYPLPDDADQRQVRKFRNRGRQIIQQVVRERQKLGLPGQLDVDQATVWELVNAVTHRVQHNKTRKGISVNDGVSRAFAGFEDAESIKAWEHAASYLAA